MNIRSCTLLHPVLVLLWLLALLVAGCAQAPPAAAPASAPSPLSAGEGYWPTAGWRISSPETQGMDPQKLARLLLAVRQQELNLHSLLIIRNGSIVSETYFPPYTAETNHEVYSVTKSVVATLIGIAIDKRFIDRVKEPVADFFGGVTFQHPDAGKDAMTLEDLLTMRSGLDWQEEDATFGHMYQSDDWVRFMLDMLMREPPGQQFRYCSGCSHLLSAIIQRRTGMNTHNICGYRSQSLAGGLEQLNRIARRILDQDLLPAIANHNRVAEAASCLFQLRDGGRQILDLQLDAVPATGGGLLPVGHGLPGPASAWPVE